MSLVATLDWENWFLYNGTLMDENGDQTIPQPRLFHSVAEAEEWLDENDIRANVQAGVRRGDRIVPKAVWDDRAERRAESGNAQ